MTSAIPTTERSGAVNVMPTSDAKPETAIERIPITKARSMIGQLVNRVHTDKEHVVLEKSGIPVVALIDFDEFKQFLAFREEIEKK